MTLSERIKDRAFRKAWENIYMDALTDGMEPGQAEEVADLAILDVTQMVMRDEKS